MPLRFSPEFHVPPVQLAPMAGVTDKPFRQIAREHFTGRMTTEMVSVSALYFGDRKTARLMDIESETDIALQIFTREPGHIERIAHLLSEHPAVSIDINMGCPAPKIVNNGEGAALMRDIALAERVVRAAVRSIAKPVTVKFRSGWDSRSINAADFARMCEAAGASAVTVHPRTRDQMYEGTADWSIIGDCKRAVSIPVTGNGDIRTPEDAARMAAETGCDSVMIGRAAMGDPWLLGDVERCLSVHDPTGCARRAVSPHEKLDTAIRHFELLVRCKTEHIAVLEMRKHAAWYMKGVPGSAPFKARINAARTADEVRTVLRERFLIEN